MSIAMLSQDTQIPAEYAKHKSVQMLFELASDW